MAKSTKSSLSARIPSDLMDEVKAYCKRNQLTQADFVTTAVQTYLQNPSATPPEPSNVADPAREDWQTAIEARLFALEQALPSASTLTDPAPAGSSTPPSPHDSDDPDDPAEEEEAGDPEELDCKKLGIPGQKTGKEADLPPKALQSIAAAVETFQKQTTELGAAARIVEIEVSPVTTEDVEPIPLSTHQAWQLARQRGYLGPSEAFMQRWERYTEKGNDRFRAEWGLERLPDSDQWLDLWDEAFDGEFAT
ncbi:MAG: hypothetical protein VKK80_13295 [Prochlorothrix sp.]|nr:hypothetical protein [Prochlorothrix sp.]